MTPDPLVGPFLTSTQLCDYSDDPGFAIPAGRDDEQEPNR